MDGALSISTCSKSKEMETPGSCGRGKAKQQGDGSGSPGSCEPAAGLYCFPEGWLNTKHVLASAGLSQVCLWWLCVVLGIAACPEQPR